MRTLVIGDIHGGYRALQQILERCNFDYNNDKIIQLGDVADGWSETKQCVDLLLDIQEKCIHKPIFIRGNHDCGVYDWVMLGIQLPMWTSQGGKETINSYIGTNEEVNRHQEFWENQIDWYIDDDNRLFIHGGWFYLDRSITWPTNLTPMELFERQASIPHGWGTKSKACHWDRDILYGAKSGSIRNNRTGQQSGFHPLKLFNEIYIGHTAIYNKYGNIPTPENYLNLWNLDTGAGWDGVLTIMDIDTKEYWQSDLVKELYSEEKGR